FLSGGAGYPSAGQRFPMIYFNLDLLPPNITITSAYLCFYPNQTMTMAGDGCYCTLAHRETDRQWLDGAKFASDVHRRNNSWNFAIHATSVPWVPAMDSRQWSYQFGTKSGSQMTFQANQPVTLDVKELVQMYLDGVGYNGGFWFHVSGLGQTYYEIHCNAPFASNSDKEPFLVVTFQTKRHSQTWQGKPVAVCLATDDAKPSNVDFAAECDLVGEKLSIAIVTDWIDTANHLTSAECAALAAAGYEVVSHSKTHTPPYGLQGCATEAILDGEVDRSLVTDLTGEDLTPTACRVMFFPRHGFNIEVRKACRDAGYMGARDGVPGTNPIAFNGVDPLGFGGDDGEASNLLKWSSLVNIFTVAPAESVTAVVGEKTHTATKDEIRKAMDRIIDLSLRNERYLIVYFWHDTKSGDYENGVDTAELALWLEVLQEDGRVNILTIGDAVSWYRATHTPSAPPAGGDSEAAGITAADKIWWDL
ncbi:MAG: hypothetical protein ABIF77_20280, partial [bacterium]